MKNPLLKSANTRFFSISRFLGILFFVAAGSGSLFAQTGATEADSIAEEKSKLKKFMEKVDKALTVTAYVDAYYAFYTDSLSTGDYQKFPSVSPRSNQFGLNVAHLGFRYDGEKVRGLVSLHYGDIQRSSWAGNVMEAQVGIRLFKKVWVDAGLFRTHVGAEGLMPKENLASSIAIPTFYEPYFEAGVRLNYNPTEKLAINFFVLNGYNIYEDNNAKKSFGFLVTYALSDKGNIGYSNYLGDDTPDGVGTVSHFKVYQNVFWNYQLAKRLKVQVGVDVAVQKNSDLDEADKSAVLYSGLATLKYNPCSRFYIYTRGEFFNDPQGFFSGVVNTAGDPAGLKIGGVTLGFEYDPTDNTYVRLEGRYLKANEDQEIFYWDGENKSGRFETMVHMGVSF